MAKHEANAPEDPTAYRHNVHRVVTFPEHPPRYRRGLRGKMAQLWIRWLCLVDADIGVVIPAVFKGISLCKRHRLNVVIVTGPPFSVLIAALIICKVAKARLIVDYRDPWMALHYAKPFGRWLCPAIERCAVRRASALVFCTGVMREEFIKTFKHPMPTHLEVIYNAFEEFGEEESVVRSPGEKATMVYAGTFYGTRRLSVIAPVLAQMLASREISAETFRFQVYARLDEEDLATIERWGIQQLMEVHDLVPYRTVQDVMRKADILFLPSGVEFGYAVPFKFFDYLGAKRPILAIAPLNSGVDGIMKLVDCGELAEFGNDEHIRRSLNALLCKTRSYTFAGSERFRWENAARQYMKVIESAANLSVRVE